MQEDMGTDSDLTREFLANRALVFGFVRALTRDLDATEEAFQEVGLRVVQQAVKGTSVAQFLPWVREIARNVVIDQRRRLSRAPMAAPLEEQIVRAFEENAMSVDESRARRRFLEECLEHLTEKVRALFRVRYAEGRPLDEAAAAVGWKIDSVKVAMSRARKSLLECMQSKLRGSEA